jgi:hypothetical protein
MKKPNRKPQQQNNSVEKPEMNDESGARYRAQLIAAGRLIEETQERNEQEEQQRLEKVQQLRKELIEQGSLRPGAGLRRLKKNKPQNRRVMQ